MPEYRSKVRGLRERQGMTQRQLADAVGVDPSTVRNWESGRNAVSGLVRVHRLCEALNADPADLYEEIPEM